MTAGDRPPSLEEQRRWRRVQSLFHRARELEHDRRAGFLDQQCAGDACLREEVAGLLEEVVDTVGDAAGGVAPSREDLSGTRLGAYELVRIVGEGGMGVIYEARQPSVVRSVALKILRPLEEFLADGGTAEAYERMVARFVDEAEVLGRLDHPGIVPIHALERDPAGRLFFTMRLVRGEDFRSIVERLHRGSPAPGGWTRHRALQVVVRVCETMAFAHERGNLHRDLKPSHVMVGRYGEVYIVDWGLAKVASRPEAKDIRLRDAAGEADASTSGGEPMELGELAPLRTIDGDVIGTPAYMPPEQARGEVGRIDARADVYAVGAMLYHLLAGQLPHLRPGERGVAPRELLARVVRGAPVPLHAFDPHLPRELVAICETAMAREPDERYASMQALRDDLQAFLETRVVRADRTGVVIEFRKWVQRNRALAAALTVVALALLSWPASVLVVQARANRKLEGQNRLLEDANARVGAERDEARSQAAIATAIHAFLDGMLRSVDPLRAQGEEVTVAEALDAAARSLPGAFPDQPEVEAAVRTTIGVTYRNLGRLADAEEHLVWALDTRRALLGDAHPDTIRSIEEVAILRRDEGELEQAVDLMREALALRGDRPGTDPRPFLRTMGNLSQVLYDRQELDEAKELARETLALQERLLGPDDADVIVSLEVLGAVLFRRGELEEAEALFRRQLEANAQHLGEDHPNTLLSATNLVSILDAMGRSEEARELGDDFVGRLEEVFGPTHRNTLVASANLALLACNQGRTEEGIARFREVLARERESLGRDHPETMLTQFNLAETLRREARSAECLPLFAELVPWQREHLPPEHLDLRDGLWGLADSLNATGRPAEAVPLLEELLAIEADVSGPDHAKTRAVRQQLELCRGRVAAARRATEPGPEAAGG